MIDTAKDHLFSTGVPMQEISRLLRNRVKPKRLVLVVDACYSGATTSRGNIDPHDLLSSTSELIIAASSPDERSWESKRYPNGVFTRQFINVICENPTTKNIHLLFPGIARLTNTEVKSDNGATQTPIAVGRWNGEEFLAVGTK